jgi:spore maturation protein CgeB
VGSDEIYAIENFYVKYLRELGAEVSLFTAQNYFYEYYNKSVLNKLFYKSALSGIIGRINGLFKAAIERFRPNIIWVFKGMEIMPESLKWAKSRKIKLVNYNPDNPFIFSGAGSGNRNVIEAVPLYDLHFTYNLAIKEKLEKDYRIKTVFLPFGFDLNDALFRTCADQGEIVRLCFAGNPDRGRAEFVKNMARAGLQIDVFGHHWNHFIKDSSVRIYPPQYGDEFWKVLRRYRVQLNLMRPHNESSHNMRTFEIPAVGGIMLAPDTREHRLFFTDRQEVILFSGINKCVEQAAVLLESSGPATTMIREKARERCLRSGYSYRERTETVLDALKKIVS